MVFLLAELEMNLTYHVTNKHFSKSILILIELYSLFIFRWLKPTSIEYFYYSSL